MSQQIEFNKEEIEIVRSAFRLYYDATYLIGNYDESMATRNNIFSVAIKLSKVVGEDITDDLL